MRNCSVIKLYRRSRLVMQQPKTAEEIKADFHAKGLTITGWARDHGFPPREVILVLNGYYECRRGRAHRIAVALGLKADPAATGANQQAA